MDDDHLLARWLAFEAGQRLLARRAEGGPADRLRAAGDLLSHEYLMAELATARPDDAVLSEEGADNPARLSARRVWIVDPLDGTREFGEPGRTDWAVHVALWADGGLVAGAVALPAQNQVLSTANPPADHDRGGFSTLGGRKSTTLSGQPGGDGPVPAGGGSVPGAGGEGRVPVGGGPVPGAGGEEPVPGAGRDRLLLVASRSRAPEWIGRVADSLGATVLPMGSAGAKAAAVINGEADAYLHGGGQFEWDSAAPVAVAQAAGLHASRIDGSALAYNQADPRVPDILICPIGLAAQLLGAIDKALSSGPPARVAAPHSDLESS